MAEPITPFDFLARAGKSLAKGIGAVLAAVLLLFGLIWIGGSGSGEAVIQPLLAVMIAIPIYFLPSFAAVSRQHSKRQAIIILNLLLGWTFLGWVAALVWAYTENRP